MVEQPFLRARDVAIEAARRAADLIRAGRQAGPVVREKGTHDLVTEVDEAAQQAIIEVLKEAFPQYDVLAEEGTDPATLREIVRGDCWMIDPLDGTTNFAHGVPPYSVSIALQQDREMVVGVVLDVAHDELFTAVQGGGAFLNGVPIRVSPTARLRDSLITTGFPYRSYDHIDQYLAALRLFMRETRGVRRPGSAAVDLAWVACGRFDGFFETGLSPWDVAAGSLIVREAGGVVTSFRRDPHYLFGRQLLASNGLLHDALLEILQPLREVFG
jgi:myo-inositol-1(or 4)-monophosphatase